MGQPRAFALARALMIFRQKDVGLAYAAALEPPRAPAPATKPVLEASGTKATALFGSRHAAGHVEVSKAGLTRLITGWRKSRGRRQTHAWTLQVRT